jgi:hypothetical protein
MTVKYLAIAGAVSLGSYEAGATYEILDAIRQHRPPYTCIQLHRLHASGIPQKTQPL